MRGDCQTCPKTDVELFVYTLPDIPMTIGNCKRCTVFNIYPYNVLVGNTAAIGGMKEAAEWWGNVVFRSLAVLDVLPTKFEEDVKEEMEARDSSPNGEGGK